MKIVAMVSRQGIACPETALHSTEDTPAARAEMERQWCHGNTDDPVAGSWRDVSNNEMIAEMFVEREDW